MNEDIIAPKPGAQDIAAWIISASALLLVFYLRLLPALLSGLLVYELVRLTAPLLRASKLSDSLSRLLVVALFAVLIAASLFFLVWWGIHFFRGETASVSILMQKMADIIDGARDRLPAWLAADLPDDADGLKSRIVAWLREHASSLQSAGKYAGGVAAHIFVGMVLGAAIALGDTKPASEYRPLARALAGRALRLSESFRAVVFAQVRISALNTLFAWLYLGVALPLFGIRLPLSKTMIVLTFLAGMLPVVGNLISNSVIIVVSLSHSLSVSAASLAFLLIIHKLEYFLNARIVGHHIHAHIWELLLAMLLMESAFGLPGVIVAPIYYAYIKRELIDQGLV
jgi:predicted PurR-regulated permease PerM